MLDQSSDQTYDFGDYAGAGEGVAPLIERRGADGNVVYLMRWCGRLVRYEPPHPDDGEPWDGLDSATTLADLADRRLWVSWRFKERNGRRTKVPINPATGGYAKADEPATWATRGGAEQRARGDGLDGVGVNLAEVGYGMALCGIDLDTCLGEDGAVAPWAAAVIDRFASYTELSPSGTGFKIFFLMRVADRDRVIEALRLRSGVSDKTGTKWTTGEGNGAGHPPAIELFLSRRYFTVTGQQHGVVGELNDTCVLAMSWLINEHGPAVAVNVSRHRANGRAQANEFDRSTDAWNLWLAARKSGRATTYEEMCAMLRADPATAAWVREKGEKHGERELRRIFSKIEERVTAAPYRINPHAPLATARLFREMRYDVDDTTTLWRQQEIWYAWNGAAYPEMEDEAIRKASYGFLEECVKPIKKRDESTEWVPVDPTRDLVNQMLDPLRAESLLEKTVEAPRWLDGRLEPRPRDIIACRNGLLHLPTGRLLPHDPRSSRTTRWSSTTTPTRRSRPSGCASSTSSGQTTPSRSRRCRRCSATAWATTRRSRRCSCCSAPSGRGRARSRACSGR